MTKHFSFSHLENEMIHQFRERINHSEDLTDLEKLFSRTAVDLVRKALADEVPVKHDDIVFDPNQNGFFRFSRRLLENNQFGSKLEQSDLGQVLGRFAASAHHRYVHLRRNPKNTESKIRV